MGMLVPILFPGWSAIVMNLAREQLPLVVRVWLSGTSYLYSIKACLSFANHLFRKTKQYPVGNPQAKYPRVSHNSIMESDQGLLDWVDNIVRLCPSHVLWLNELPKI